MPAKKKPAAASKSNEPNEKGQVKVASKKKADEDLMESDDEKPATTKSSTKAAPKQGKFSIFRVNYGVIFNWRENLYDHLAKARGKKVESDAVDPEPETMAKGKTHQIHIDWSIFVDFSTDFICSYYRARKRRKSHYSRARYSIWIGKQCQRWRWRWINVRKRWYWENIQR